MVNLPAPFTGGTELSRFGWRRPPRPTEVQELWNALRVNLTVLNLRINRRLKAGGGTEIIDPEIDRLLEAREPECQTFERLYEAKLRLAALMEDADVRADAARRFAEAAQIGVPSAAALEARFNAATTDEKERKALYVALLDDLHLRYQRRTLDRRERRQKAAILNRIGLGLLIPAVIVTVYVLGPRGAADAPAGAPSAFGAVLTAVAGLIGGLQSSHIVAVVWFGLIGAYLSQMIALHGVMKTIEYDDLATEFNISAVFFRLMLGALGSLLMYFLIVGDFLNGALFPHWSSGGITVVAPAPGGPSGTPAVNNFSQDFAKLLIWSTIAGFSERLIPDRFTAMARVVAERKS